MISESELDKQADAILEAEVAKRRAALKQDLLIQERRKATMAHMDRINAHHPVEDPPSAEEIAQRHRWAAESLARDDERIRANEARWLAEEEKRTKQPPRLPKMGGQEGFEIKRR
jgi:hypothetical protein